MFDIGWKLPSSKSDAGDSSIDDDAASDAADSIDYQMNLRTVPGSSSYNTIGVDEGLEKSDDESVSSDACVSIPLKRITFSARESPMRLQRAGIKQLLDESQDSNTKSDPTVFGFDSDYSYLHVVGVSSRYHQGRVGSTKDGFVGQSTRKRRTFKDVFNIKEHRKAKPAKILGLDLDQYSYRLRVSDKSIWPRSNEKMVASTKTAHQMISSRPVVDWCRNDGILPIVTHPIKNGRSVRVAIGPYLDPDQNPYPVGSCFRAAGVYTDFGMRLHVDHNEAWRSNAETISAFFLRCPPKNSLPLSMPPNERMSAYAEMKRIIAKQPRVGFDIYRSGGNCALKGNAPPGSGARSAGEGAFFEHEQTVKNAYNLALETVSEAGRPLAVFGAGSLFPSDYHDQALVQEIGQLEQAFYFGTYTVRALGERPALTLEEIQAIMIEYVPIYKELSSMKFAVPFVPASRVPPCTSGLSLQGRWLQAYRN